jgi:predicted MFS family arabinose efflux permease
MMNNATYATPPINATLKSTTAAGPMRLPSRAAFYLVASITLTFLAGSSAPTPLYALYQAQWGFSSTMLTVAFGVYAIAVLSSLLVVGRLSDHVGRRPVLMVAALMQAFAMVILATAHGLPDLLIGRVVQGLSAGAALAAVGAGLLDLDKSRGALANAVAPMMGTAIGGVLAGLMVQYLPAPLHLVYVFLAVVFIAQAVGVFFIEETANPRTGALASLKPTIALPSNVRGAMLIAVPALIAVWTLGGFYASLGPRLVKHLAGSNSILLGGVALFVLAGSGALAVLLLHLHDAQRLMRIGTSALIVGVGVALAGVSANSMPLFLIGTAIAGVGFGTGFQGALRSVIGLIEPQQRAGVLSVLFVVSYLALGVPAIAAGYRLAQHGDIVEIAQDLGAIIVLLAALALIGTFRRRA